MKVEGQGMALERLKAEKPQRPITVEQVASKEVKDKPAREESKVPNAIDERTLVAAMATLNEAMKISNYHCEFKLHKESGRFQIKLVDNTSNEIIKEIPPESALELSAHIKEMVDNMIGLLIDERI